jgi:hypothetical protein
MMELFKKVNRKKPVIFVEENRKIYFFYFHKYRVVEDDKYNYIFIKCSAYDNILSVQKIKEAKINGKLIGLKAKIIN